MIGRAGTSGPARGSWAHDRPGTIPSAKGAAREQGVSCMVAAGAQPGRLATRRYRVRSPRAGASRGVHAGPWHPGGTGEAECQSFIVWPSRQPPQWRFAACGTGLAPAAGRRRGTGRARAAILHRQIPQELHYRVRPFRRNGDVNPYGVAVVARSQGSCSSGQRPGQQLQQQGNLQGTGTTIVQVSPAGRLTHVRPDQRQAPAGHLPGRVGLTTALTILHGGWVVVGSLPTTTAWPPRRRLAA